MKRVATALALFVTGCTVPKEAGFPDVQKQVEPRTGHKIFWNRGGEADEEVRRAVRKMTAHPLSAAEAVQIALLNNKHLQGVYEELMIAQADVVQAGLLKNPVFSAGVQFPLTDVQPDSGGTTRVVDLDVEQDFLSLLLIPARKRIAKAAFEAAKMRVGSEVIHLAYDVREAYFMLQGALHIVSMRQKALEAAEASRDFAQTLFDAGNLNEATIVEERAAVPQFELDLARSHADAYEAREKLTRLMGLWGKDAGFSVVERLPELPATDPSLEHAESIAVARRLDLSAASHEMQARSHSVAMAKNWRFLGGAGVGGHYHAEPDGRFVGPTGAVDVPLFDQKQAVIAGLEAELRQSRARYEALAVEVRSEVREARFHVKYARDRVDYLRKTVIPLRERLVTLKVEQHNAMAISVFELLIAKQNEVNAYREYLEAIRDYWIARSHLDRVAGGRVSGPVTEPARPSAIPSPPPSEAPSDHHHGH